MVHSDSNIKCVEKDYHEILVLLIEVILISMMPVETKWMIKPIGF